MADCSDWLIVQIVQIDTSTDWHFDSEPLRGGLFWTVLIFKFFKYGLGAPYLGEKWQ